MYCEASVDFTDLAHIYPLGATHTAQRNCYSDNCICHQIWLSMGKYMHGVHSNSWICYKSWKFTYTTDEALYKEKLIDW